MSSKNQVVFHESRSLGKGLPFAIVEPSVLMANNDIFEPSLRDFHVIFWFKKGTGKYYIDFEEYEISANSIILVSKDNLHYFEPFTESCELQSIVFKPDFIYRNDMDLKHLFHFDAGCYYEGKQILKLNATDIDFFETISKQMLNVFHQWEGQEREEAFYHLLCLFLLQSSKIQNNLHESRIEPNKKEEMILRFNQLLEDHYKTEIKVEFYVEKLGTTVKTLSRLVKQQYNVSTKSVIDERRSLEIKRLLRGTTMPVKEIAYDLSFDEPTNMVKYFKKHTGFTPNGFRKSFVY